MNSKPSSSPIPAQSFPAKFITVPVVITESVIVAPIKSGATPPSDFIAKTVLETEMLSKESAFALAAELIEGRCKGDFALGCVLTRILDKGKFDKAWLEGYPNFKTLCKKRFGFDYRTAKYLIDIYRYLVDNQISGHIVESLGWTKVAVLVEAKELTKKNVSMWEKKGKKLSVKQLKAVVDTAPEDDPAADLQPKKQPKTEASSKVDAEQAFNDLEAAKQKKWDDRLDALREGLKAAFPTGSDAAESWLRAFERGWAEAVVTVEFAE